MEYMNLHWSQLKPNPLNELVRGVIERSELEELADSIRENDVIEPLVVVPDGDGYQIVSGERRWRAAQLLGETAPLLPCVVREPMEEIDQLVVMGVENLQRNDLGPMDEARYFDELRRRGLDVPEIVRRTGCRRSRVDGRLRLLDLHPDVQAMIARGAIPMSADRVLVKLDSEEQAELCKRMTGRSVGAIKRAVDVVLQRKERAAAKAIAGTNSRRNGHRIAKTLTVKTISGAELELAVRATCAACEVHAEVQHELRWDDVKQALDDQCERCEVREMREACAMCPLVDFLRLLRMQTLKRGEPVGPAHLYDREVLGVNGKHR